MHKLFLLQLNSSLIVVMLSFFRSCHVTNCDVHSHVDFWTRLSVHACSKHDKCTHYMVFWLVAVDVERVMNRMPNAGAKVPFRQVFVNQNPRLVDRNALGC